MNNNIRMMKCLNCGHIVKSKTTGRTHCSQCKKTRFVEVVDFDETTVNEIITLKKQVTSLKVRMGLLEETVKSILSEQETSHISVPKQQVIVEEPMPSAPVPDKSAHNIGKKTEALDLSDPFCIVKSKMRNLDK
jgi:DNA-directed RNA polymerase subunit RPC12/RpoP